MPRHALRPYYCEPLTGTALIHLTQGQVAIVDLEDAPFVSQWNWYFGSDGYACRRSGKPFKHHYAMHREILIHAGIGLEGHRCDHKNMNRIDNRRENLRPTMKAHEREGVVAITEVKGVSWSAERRMWRATISVDGRQVHLGLFTSQADAHAAYCDAALQFAR